MSATVPETFPKVTLTSRDDPSGGSPVTYALTLTPPAPDDCDGCTATRAMTQGPTVTLNCTGSQG